SSRTTDSGVPSGRTATVTSSCVRTSPGTWETSRRSGRNPMPGNVGNVVTGAGSVSVVPSDGVPELAIDTEPRPAATKSPATAAAREGLIANQRAGTSPGPARPA